MSEGRSQCVVACVFHKASDLVIMASWLQVGTFSLRVLLLIGPSMAHDVESFRCSGCSSSPCLFISFSCLAQGAEQICASSAKVWTRDCSSFIAFACRSFLRIAAYFAQASGCCWNQVRSLSSSLELINGLKLGRSMRDDAVWNYWFSSGATYAGTWPLSGMEMR